MPLVNVRCSVDNILLQTNVKIYQMFLSGSGHAVSV